MDQNWRCIKIRNSGIDAHIGNKMYFLNSISVLFATFKSENTLFFNQTFSE